MKRKMLCVSLILIACILALSGTAVADGRDDILVTNYPELLSALDSGERFIIKPADEFLWPDEDTTVAIRSEACLDGDLTIPENVTLELYGDLLQRWSGNTGPVTLSVNGTLHVFQAKLELHGLQVHGTLTLEKNAIVNIGEGVIRETGTLCLADQGIGNPGFHFYSDPEFYHHIAGNAFPEYSAHWTFYEGARFISEGNSRNSAYLSFDTAHLYVGSTYINPPVLLEAVGNLETSFSLTQYTESDLLLNGNWSVRSLEMRGTSALTVHGTAATEYVQLLGPQSDGEEELYASVVVPAGSSLTVSHSVKANNSNNLIQLDGEMTLAGRVQIADVMRFRGTGTLHAVSQYDNGRGQPVFGEISFDDIIADRAAFADSIDPDITITRSWAALDQPSLAHFVKIQTYENQFEDVTPGAWYAESVATAYELGLVKGASATNYNRKGDIKISETIVLACRIHSIYVGDGETFEKVGDEKYYMPYVRYAIDRDIIAEGEYQVYNVAASREQFAAILAHALPEKELAPMNTVADGAIPDVAMTNAHAAEIYMLYRAGVLTGNDSYGTFKPESNIQRSEVAAIIVRMAIPAERRHMELG